jgi:hypothetical protein
VERGGADEDRRTLGLLSRTAGARGVIHHRMPRRHLEPKLLPDAERTFAAVAVHIGRAYLLQLEVLGVLLAGSPPPPLLDELDERNARDAQVDREATNAQCLEILDDNALRLNEFLSTLTDEELANPIVTADGREGPPLMAIINETVIGQPRVHLDELHRVTAR